MPDQITDTEIISSHQTEANMVVLRSLVCTSDSMSVYCSDIEIKISFQHFNQSFNLSINRSDEERHILLRSYILRSYICFCFGLATFT